MKLLFWMNASRPNRHGHTPILMRITISGKRTELNTNISVPRDTWDGRAQMVTGNGSLVKEYNKTLQAFGSAAWNHYNDALRRGLNITPQIIFLAPSPLSLPTALYLAC